MKSLIVLNECMFSEKQKSYLRKKFSNVEFYTNTTNERLAINRIGQKNIIIMDQFILSFSEKLLMACTNLELIIVNTTAYNNIDIHLLNKYGIKLANLRSYATRDVAEVALSMILELNNYSNIAQKIVNGKSIGNPKNTYREKVNDIWPGHPILPLIVRRQLKSQTIGIVGLGNIGKECAELCMALGMKILGYNRSKSYMKGIEIVSLRKLFRESDVILIALAYAKNENEHIISQDLLSLAKKDSLLVSISHPNLIDISYLIKNHNKFRGIGFDYLVTSAVRELMQVRKDNIIITPHLGSQSFEAIANMTEDMIKSVINFSEGKPIHLVE